MGKQGQIYWASWCWRRCVCLNLSDATGFSWGNAYQQTARQRYLSPFILHDERWVSRVLFRHLIWNWKSHFSPQLLLGRLYLFPSLCPSFPSFFLHPSIFPPAHYLNACMRLSVLPSIYLSSAIRPAIHPSVRPSIHACIHPSIHPFVHKSLYISV